MSQRVLGGMIGLVLLAVLALGAGLANPGEEESSSTERRLASLESTVRLLTQQMERETLQTRVVRAEKIELVDEDGHVRSVFDRDGIRLCKCLELWCNGIIRARQLEFPGPKGDAAARMSADGIVYKTHSIVRLPGDSILTVGYRGEGPDDWSGGTQISDGKIVLKDRKRRARVVMSATGGGQILLTDETGVPLISLGAGEGSASGD